tara:strand:+ start:17393 stop:18364 length:972 start_codon:yes stop_codon:yes gene_type:complete
MKRSELHGLYETREYALEELRTGARFGNASTLHKDDFVSMSDDVVSIRKHKSIGVQDLKDAGLTRSVNLSDTLIQYYDVNDFEAQVSLNGSNRINQQTDYAPKYTPQPIYDAPWFIPFRQEGFSYKQADGARESAIAVVRKMDQVCFVGSGNILVNYEGKDQQLHGYINHPSTLPYPNLNDWTDVTNSDEIYKDVNLMVAELYNKGKTVLPNEAVLYVSTDFWTPLQQDYSTQKGQLNSLERILAMSEIGQVKPVPYLPSKTALLVQMSEDTVQWAESMDVTNVAHPRIHAYEDQQFTAMAAGALLIKTDRNGVTGIVYGTTS